MNRFFIILFAVVFSGCSASIQNTSSVTDYKNFSLQIIHFNDIHSSDGLDYDFNYDNGTFKSKAGGFPRLIEALSNIEKEANSEIIFAGDLYQQGYPLFSYTKGLFDYKMMCLTAPSIITFGNHEIYETDTGVLNLFFDNYIKNKDNCSFDILISNITFDNATIQSNIKPYIIKDYNGEKVGYIGVTTNESGYADIKGVKVSDPIIAVEKAVLELKSKNVNKIIVISHLGFEEDKKLGERVKDIDLIIGGHSHTIQGDFSTLGVESYEKNYPFVVDNSSVNIVTAGHHGLFLGDITVNFNNNGIISNSNGRSRMLIDYQDNNTLNERIGEMKNFLLVKDNESALKEVKEIYDNITDEMNKVIGYTEDNLTTLKALANFNKENHYSSSLGTLLSKGLYLAGKNIGVNPDMAFINSGAVRVNINKGDITRGIIEQAVPYENELLKVSLKGSVISEYIREMSYNLMKSYDVNAFPVVYGGKFKYDYSNNVLLEQLVLSNGSYISLDNDTIYNVIMSSFLYNDYEPFKTNGTAVENLGITDKASYIDFIINNSPLKMEEDSIIIK